MTDYNTYKLWEVKYIMKYTKPVAELEKFTAVDVVTTSTGGGSTPTPGPIVTPGAE